MIMLFIATAIIAKSGELKLQIRKNTLQQELVVLFSCIYSCGYLVTQLLMPAPANQ